MRFHSYFLIASSARVENPCHKGRMIAQVHLVLKNLSSGKRQRGREGAPEPWISFDSAERSGASIAIRYRRGARFGSGPLTPTRPAGEDSMAALSDVAKL